MAKNNRKSRLSIYPEEREGRVKDANRKLKAQVRNLQKVVKQLEWHNKTLQKAFDKSCDFIQERLSGKDLEEIIDMINGRESQSKQKKEACPKCEREEGYKVMTLNKFIIKKCICGYRSKADGDEGIKRS